MKFLFKLLVVLLFLDLSAQTLPASTTFVDQNFQVNYHVVNNNLQIEFILQNGMNGWMTVVFNTFPFPADSIVAWWDPETNQALVWDAYNPGIPTLPSFPSPLQDTDPTLNIPNGAPNDNQNNVKIIYASNQNGIIDIILQRPLITRDILDIQLETGGQYRVNLMYNPHNGFINTYDAVQPGYPMGAVSKSAIWYLN